MRQIMLTRSRALVIVTICFFTAAWGAFFLFRFVQQQRGVEDGRLAQVSIAYAAISFCLWLWNVVRILRSRSRIWLPLCRTPVE